MLDSFTFKSTWLVCLRLGFANLCALASLREPAFPRRTAHAKAQSRKGKPQSETLLISH